MRGVLNLHVIIFTVVFEFHRDNQAAVIDRYNDRMETMLKETESSYEFRF